MLKRFGRNITKIAEDGYITPLIGRYKELKRINRVLLSKDKNNLLLIGEHGVGKTAIVEGLAKRIVQEKVPEELVDKQIVSLNFSTLTKSLDKLEERLNEIISEIKESENIILFIDDIHALVANRQSSKKVDEQGNLSDSEFILAKLLVQEDIQFIATTTPDEYRKKIEKSKLGEFFQTIVIESPSLNEACYILRGLRHKYEKRHNLFISTDSLRAAVELSDRYIEDRNLPDKALQVIDRACFLVCLKNFQDEEYQNIQKRLRTVGFKRKIAEIKDNKKALSRLEPHEAALQIILEERITVTTEHVAEVISKITGIPLNKLEF